MNGVYNRFNHDWVDIDGFEGMSLSYYLGVGVLHKGGGFLVSFLCIVILVLVTC